MDRDAGLSLGLQCRIVRYSTVGGRSAVASLVVRHLTCMPAISRREAMQVHVCDLVDVAVVHNRQENDDWSRERSGTAIIWFQR